MYCLVIRYLLTSTRLQYGYLNINWHTIYKFVSSKEGKSFAISYHPRTQISVSLVCAPMIHSMYTLANESQKAADMFVVDGQGVILSNTIQTYIDGQSCPPCLLEPGKRNTGL